MSDRQAPQDWQLTLRELLLATAVVAGIAALLRHTGGAGVVLLFPIGVLCLVVLQLLPGRFAVAERLAKVVLGLLALLLLLFYLWTVIFTILPGSLR